MKHLFRKAFAHTNGGFEMHQGLHTHIYTCWSFFLQMWQCLYESAMLRGLAKPPYRKALQTPMQWQFAKLLGASYIHTFQSSSYRYMVASLSPHTEGFKQTYFLWVWMMLCKAPMQRELCKDPRTSWNPHTGGIFKAPIWMGLNTYIYTF